MYIIRKVGFISIGSLSCNILSIVNPASVRLGVIYPDRDKTINILIMTCYYALCV